MTIETLESEFAEALTTIATGLGTAAEHIFGIFVSAQVMIGILDTISILLVIIGVCIAVIYTRKWCIRTKDVDKDTIIWLPWLSAIATAFAGWIITEQLSLAILKMCCPEYTAMQEIIKLVIP